MHVHHKLNHNEQRHSDTKRVTVVGAIVNLALGIIKIIFGIIGHSSALVADGIHSLSDLLCDALVLTASSFSQHEADEEHPYGHRRFETAATLLLGLVLIAMAIIIAFDAIDNIINRVFWMPDKFTIIIAFISIIANECLFRYTLAVANKIRSKLLSANAWHSRADALSSVVVLVGLLGAIAGWEFLDDIAAVVVALFIAKIGFEWGWSAFSEITDRGLEKADLQKIKDCILKTDGVKRLHQLRTRTMADKILLDVHILIDPYLTASEGHHIAERVRYHLSKTFPEITDITIHVDVEDHKETLPENLLPSRQMILNKLMPNWLNVLEKHHIDAIHLYYIKDGIEVTIELNIHDKPLTQEMVNHLKASIIDYPEIKKISCMKRL